MKIDFKLKRALAMLLVLVMLFGQSELLVPRVSAAPIDDAVQTNEEINATPSAQAEGSVSMPVFNDPAEGEPEAGLPGGNGGDEEPETAPILTIPLLAGPAAGQWLQFTLEDRDFTLTIPAAGNYTLGFAMTSGVEQEINFSFNYTIDDHSGAEPINMYTGYDATRTEGDEFTYWCMNWPQSFFDAPSSGNYTISFSNTGVYYPEAGDEEPGALTLSI